MRHPADGCGVYDLAEIRELGGRGSPLDEVIQAWSLTRLRRGWYSARTADARVVEAVLAGGVVSCVTALDMTGIWVPKQQRGVHVRACPSAMRSAKAGRYCRAIGGPTPERRAVDDLETALLHAVNCLDDEGVVAVLDSVQNQRLLTDYDLATLFAKSKEFNDCSTSVTRTLNRVWRHMREFG